MAGPFDEALQQLRKLGIERIECITRPVAQSNFPSKSKSHERAQHYVMKLKYENKIADNMQSVVINLSTLAHLIEGIISKERHDAKLDMATLICHNVASGCYGKDLPENKLHGLADDISAEIENIERD